jgi:hypothetical protein
MLCLRWTPDTILHESCTGTYIGRAWRGLRVVSAGDRRLGLVARTRPEACLMVVQTITLVEMPPIALDCQGSSPASFALYRVRELSMHFPVGQNITSRSYDSSACTRVIGRYPLEMLACSLACDTRRPYRNCFKRALLVTPSFPLHPPPGLC